MTFMALTGTALARARVLLVVIPAFLLFGYNQSNIGGVLDYPSFVKRVLNYERLLGNTTASSDLDFQSTGTVVAIYTIGCLMGALGITQLGNRIGRRKSLITAAIVATIGLLIQATSFGLAQLIVGRILSGVGNGGVNAVVPVWQSECSKPRSRGKNVVIIGIFIATGIAAAGWTNYGLSHVSHSEIAWRLPLALPVVFTLILIASPMFFPESPRWLVSKGRIAEARAAMIALSDTRDIDEDRVMLEIHDISSALKEASTSERGFVDLFRSSPQRLFYRFCLAIGINFCAQMTGANAISYYGTTIFRSSLGLAQQKASLLNAGVLTWKIFAAILAYLTVDRFGRRPLFIISSLGMGVSMAALAISVWAIQTKPTYAASVSATFFLFFYMTFFPLGFLGANFLYSSEIAPQDLRVHLAAVGTATHWLFNFVIAEITPIAFVTIKYRYYIVYAVIGIFAAILVYFFFPETKGLSLEEMSNLFCETEHWWQVPAHSRTMRQNNGMQQEREDKLEAVIHTERVDQ
ncbi:hypothetical protein N7486_000286 [Penicillium sp. IBT 16267x]|nr:hypothetical protein N7486_000286 [Penicillium sp. IBT 16267x]